MSLNGSNISFAGSIEPTRIEAEIRCHECDKLFTKVFFTVDLPPELSHVKHFSVSEIFPELEIKVEIETKCRGCKNMDYKIFVI